MIQSPAVRALLIALGAVWLVLLGFIFGRRATVLAPPSILERLGARRGGGGGAPFSDARVPLSAAPAIGAL